MTVASGVIPYDYEGPYPFRVPDNHSIGFSGILFEQAMTVHTAEKFRFAGSTDDPPVYLKYFTFDGPAEDFTPRPDGHNLDGRVNGIPAGAFFIDYILDLRSSLSSVNGFASFDLGGSTTVFLKDWLLWVGSTSGTRGLFTRVQFPLGSNSGPIFSADFDDLGASGVIADIDLREVSYQPYSRMSATRTVTYNLASVQIASIFPGFMSTNGVFVNLNSREQALSFTSQGITRTSADYNAGLMILDGDMFFTDTDFSLVPGTVTRDNLDAVITHNAYSPALSLPGRIFFGNANNTVDPRASAIVSPIALSPGGYGIGAINSLSAHPKLVVPSGTLSFKPAIPYGGTPAGSGFYVFDETFWIEDDEKLNPSGLRLLNPLTRSSFVWFRIADQTNTFDDLGGSHAWSSQNMVGLIDNGTNYLKMSTMLPASAGSDETKMGFFSYEKSTLDLVSVDQPIQDWTVFGASFTVPGVLVHASWNGSQYYAYTNSSFGPARNIFIFDSGFILADSKFYGAHLLTWIQGNIFTGGDFGADEETVYELIIDPDTGNDTVTDTGIAYTVDVTVAAWPTSHVSPVTKIYPPKNITGSPHFADGTWMLAINGAGTVVMFRGELSGSSIVPQEGFVLSMLSAAVSARAGYEFVHGTFT
jgi:hypothetical protein